MIGRGRVRFAAVIEAVNSSGYDGEVVLGLETRTPPFASKEPEITAAVEHGEHARLRPVQDALVTRTVPESPTRSLARPTQRAGVQRCADRGRGIQRITKASRSALSCA